MKQAGILNQGNRNVVTLIFILLFSCTSKLDKTIDFPPITKSDLSKAIRKNLIDSITNWGENKIEPYNYSILKTWYIDSLLAFNNDTSRLICAYMYNNDDTTDHDGICFFLGEKIRNKWFFLKVLELLYLVQWLKIIQ